MSRLFLVLIIVIGIQKATAQSAGDSLRAFYIQSYPKHFLAYPVIKYRSLSFEVKDENSSRKVIFKPNNSASMGVGLYVFGLTLELTAAIPLDENSQKIYGETSARDLQLNILTKSWGLDIYSQKYAGFYKDDSRISIPGGDPYPQRQDVDTRNFGVSGFYVFKKNQFSMRAPYNFLERQLISRGSFILYGTLNSFKVEADSALLSAQSQMGFGDGSDFKELRYTTLSIGPGYSYTFVYKRLFLNGSLTIGPAHHWVYYNNEQDEQHYDINFNVTNSIRFAAGYNSSRFFGGVAFIVQSRVVKFEEIQFTNSSSTIRFLIGYRFKKIGILEKNAWDLLPFLRKE